MPNWCENSLYIESTPEDIAAIKAAILNGDNNEQGLLNHLRPQPTYPEERAENQMPHWYNWRVENWGTKWEVDAEITGETETSIYICFHSAWAPPVEALRFWKEQDEQRIVDLRYMEWGMMFCGIFDNFADEQFSIPTTVEAVQELIPPELDEQFGISEMIEQWELEEAEEAKEAENVD